MTFVEPTNFVKILKNLINEEIDKKNSGLSIWRVTDIKGRDKTGYITEYKCQIKHLNFKYTLDDVPLLGIGLGNMKGVLKYPNVDDFVIVAFFDSKPMILGTVFDFFTTQPDSIPLIKLNELIFVQKENGSLILMKENNDIIFRASDETGDFEKGAKFRINHDGTFKLLNKDGYGISCDINGNITISGTTIIHTQTPINWT